jgi:hypothetical protein
MTTKLIVKTIVSTRGVWQAVTMDILKFHPGPPSPTLLRPAGTHFKHMPIRMAKVEAVFSACQLFCRTRSQIGPLTIYSFVKNLFDVVTL